MTRELLSVNDTLERHAGRLTARMLSEIARVNGVHRELPPGRQHGFQYDNVEVTRYLDSLDTAPMADEIPDHPNGFLIWTGLLVSGHRHSTGPLTREQRQKRNEYHRLYGRMGDLVWHWDKNGCPLLEQTYIDESGNQQGGRHFKLIRIGKGARERAYVVKKDFDDMLATGKKPAPGNITRKEAHRRIGSNVYRRYSDSAGKRYVHNGVPHRWLGHLIRGTLRYSFVVGASKPMRRATDANEADVETIRLAISSALSPRVFTNPVDGLQYVPLKEATALANISHSSQLGLWHDQSNPEWGGVAVRSIMHEIERECRGKREPMPPVRWYCVADCGRVREFLATGKIDSPNRLSDQQADCLINYARRAADASESFGPELKARFADISGKQDLTLNVGRAMLARVQTLKKGPGNPRKADHGLHRRLRDEWQQFKMHGDTKDFLKEKHLTQAEWDRARNCRCKDDGTL